MEYRIKLDGSAKTMILWTRKGCRKPKMLGTATAACSAATIHDMRCAARAGEGRLWIVDASSAVTARAAIARHKAGASDAELMRWPEEVAPRRTAPASAYLGRFHAAILRVVGPPKPR